MTESGISAVDLLKVDIGGAERQVFSGQPAWLGSVSYIVVELHQGYSLTTLGDDLCAVGFAVAPPDTIGNPMIFAFRA